MQKLPGVFQWGENKKNLEYYVTPILKDGKPDILVIHIGFNGIGF